MLSANIGRGCLRRRQIEIQDYNRSALRGKCSRCGFTNASKRGSARNHCNFTVKQHRVLQGGQNL
jgi:hypothetical protein